MNIIFDSHFYCKNNACNVPRDAFFKSFISAAILQQFHEAAYLADDRHDLLNAINSFLDCSIVLPPSEVGGDELLRSVARFQREMLRKREELEVKMMAKEPKSLEDKGKHFHFNQAGFDVLSCRFIA